uniref:Isoprene synthase, chloroplastic n=1 Tax=Populus alba TaxID=43335 RepID=A0A4U5MBJ6_POPAL|nr:probable terpene synthase 6 [Populus alba]TKR66322.1 terpene synthase/cyclase family protein [Populus alba]
METQAHLTASSNRQNNSRPEANFPPSLWGCSFASFSFPQTEFESYSRKVEVLKENVKDMLMASKKDTVEHIEFINQLCRLGVSYHFDDEIENSLKEIFYDLPNLLEKHDFDLYTVSLLFRVLRQHGFKIPCVVFDKFKDTNEEFKKTIINDVKGILSLYEASFLSVHGEQVLDEALVFTKANLESSATQSSPRLADHIRNALIRPFHKGVPRIEARKYISFYEEDESRIDTLLKFAKIDFNRVQLLHRQELSILSRWWNDLNFAEELPYARDRIVEIYFWANGIHFEPQYAFSRMMVTKYTKLVSLVDDTYDAYASFEEIQHFTNAIERCSMNAIDQLPADYMKVLYRALLNLFNETENDMGKQGRSYASYYLKEEYKEVVRGYHAEAEWADKCHVPTFDEYVRNGLATSAYGVIMAASFLGMEEVAGGEEYEWLKSNPKIIKAGKMIGRLMNDIVGHEDEQKRGDCASGVECYMKQYDASEKKAIEEIQKMDVNAWKDINEDCMRPTNAPMLLLQHFVNLIRVTDVSYGNDDDAFTIPSSLKDYVTLLYIEQVPMYE